MPRPLREAPYFNGNILSLSSSSGLVRSVGADSDRLSWVIWCSEDPFASYLPDADNQLLLRTV